MHPKSIVNVIKLTWKNLPSIIQYPVESDNLYWIRWNFISGYIWGIREKNAFLYISMFKGPDAHNIKYVTLFLAIFYLYPVTYCLSQILDP